MNKKMKAGLDPQDYIDVFRDAETMTNPVCPDPIKISLAVIMGVPPSDFVLAAGPRKQLEDLVAFYKKNAVPGRILAAQKLFHRHCTEDHCVHSGHGAPQGGMLQ